MAVRKRGSSWAVTVWDPERKDNVYVGTCKTRREAKALEEAEKAKRRRLGRRSSETCDSFAKRWTRDYPRRQVSTNLTNAEGVKRFAQDFAGRPLASVNRQEAREWALRHACHLPRVRAMFNDALRDGIIEMNPFAGAGIERSPGRRHKPIFEQAGRTDMAELNRLADVARATWPGELGCRFAAMIVFAAMTALRNGELFAVRWSDLITNDDGTVDVYVGRQFCTKTHTYRLPKYDSVGTVVVLEPALQALAEIPRHLDGGVIFRTTRGHPFTQSSLTYYWHPVRAAYGEPDLDWYDLRHFAGSYMVNVLLLEPWIVAEHLRHDDGGTLVRKLYGHPSDRVAREQIRRAYQSNVKPLRSIPGASREHEAQEGR